MTPERWREVDHLLQQALDLPAEERTEFLGGACGGDAALRQDVEGLLEAHGIAEDEDFLRDLPTPALASPSLDEAPLPSSKRCGPFLLLQPLGHGGMGIVYEAERVDAEYRQKVAVKVIRDGLQTPQQLQRFKSERQILANLDHPNIARLFEGGTTEEGQLYFAMERIDGQPLDEYCDHHRLSIEDRLALFQKVCDAVLHAHRSLVVHRDIKPSNILVTATGEPKLLDFGIAKVLAPDVLPHTVEATLPGSQPMTPHFASPELLRGDAITIAADVYALGVLLHKLLSGTLPHRFHGLPPAEMARQICGQTLPPPSALMRSQKRDSGGFGLPGMAPEYLAKRLAGDLDNIILKALRSEPAQRYGSVEALQEDLRRYAAGLPVRARPATWRYRSGKFLRRNFLAVSVAAGTSLLILAFAVAMAWQAKKIAEQRDLAEASRRQVEQERDRAQRVTEFMVGLFAAANPLLDQGKEPTARDLLDAGAKKVREELSDEGVVRAAMLTAMGQSYQILDVNEPAERLLEEAVEIYVQAADADPLDLAQSLQALGTFHTEQGNLARAEEAHRRALKIRRQQLGETSEWVASSLSSLGAVHQAAGRLAEAEDVLTQATDLYEELLGPDHLDLAPTLGVFGRVCLNQGRLDRAEELLTRVVEIYEAHGGLQEPQLGTAFNNLGIVFSQRGAHRQALDMWQRGLEIHLQTYGPMHGHVATILTNMAIASELQGDLDEAERRYGEAQQIYTQLFGPDHPGISTVLLNLGGLQVYRGRFTQARENLLRAQEISRLLGTDHWAEGNILYWLGEADLLQGTPQKAAETFQEALRAYSAGLEPDHFLVGLSQVMAGHSRFHATAEGAEGEAAVEQIRLGIEILEGSMGEDMRLVRGLTFLGQARAQQGDEAEALQLFAQAQDIGRRVVEKTPEDLDSQLELARALVSRAVLEEERGRPLPHTDLEQAVDLLATTVTQTNLLRQHAVYAQALLLLGRFEEARKSLDFLHSKGSFEPQVEALARRLEGHRARP